MTDNNKIGTNCRRYNTHQGGTIDTTKNRLVGQSKTVYSWAKIIQLKKFIFNFRFTESRSTNSLRYSAQESDGF